MRLKEQGGRAQYYSIGWLMGRLSAMQCKVCRSLGIYVLSSTIESFEINRLLLCVVLLFSFCFFLLKKYCELTRKSIL